MIKKEDILKELSSYQKLYSLEPLWDDVITVDINGFSKSYSYEELCLEYNRLIDNIEHLLWKIHELDCEVESYNSALQQISDAFYG